MRSTDGPRRKACTSDRAGRSGLLNSSRGTASRRPGTIIIIICRLSTMPHHHDGRGEGVTGGRSAAPSPASPSPARAFSASRPPPPGGRQVCRLSRMMRGLRDPRQAAFAVRRPASSISRWRAMSRGRSRSAKPERRIRRTPAGTGRRRATARPSARLRRERRKGRARPRGRSRSAPRSVQRLRLRDLDEFDHSNGPLSRLIARRRVPLDPPKRQPLRSRENSDQGKKPDEVPVIIRHLNPPAFAPIVGRASTARRRRP